MVLAAAPIGNDAPWPLRCWFVAVVGAVVRPRGAPAWVAPALAALAGVLTGVVALDAIGPALRPLAAPVAFLVVAVPLAVALDRLGFFEALAARIAGGPGTEARLWVLAALVTTVFNLDAAVVLLTPLYVRIARRLGLDPVALAFQPALLACLASSALPVSNLTNLVVAERFDLSALAFLVHLGPASVAASVAGWFAYRRCFGPATPTVERCDGATSGDLRALRIGGAVTVGVLVGFVAGPSVGVEPWVVAAVAAVVVAIAIGEVPWRSFPVGTAVLVGALGVLAPAAAQGIGVGDPLGATRTAELALTTVGAAGGANLANNLPALLVALDRAPDRVSDGVWAALLGFNVGPALLVTGSLSGLLWLDAVRRLGVEVTARDHSWVGVRVGLPALAAATLALLATLALA